MAADLDSIYRAFLDHTYDFVPSGYAKMRKRGLTVEQLDAAICDDAPEVIEDYPEDQRGPSCLILGWADMARPLHVLIGYGDEPGSYIDVITVYEPDEKQWYNHRRRR